MKAWLYRLILKCIALLRLLQLKKILNIIKSCACRDGGGVRWKRTHGRRVHFHKSARTLAGEHTHSGISAGM